MAKPKSDNENERLDHHKISNNKLNSLRAAVLGANDGIVSVASIILGVAGATNDRTSIFTAGMAGLAAGALSMAVGEYVSVSSQRDTEEAYITKEKWHLDNHAKEEFEDLAAVYHAKGLTKKTARTVARELTEHDAVRAHIDVELGIDEDELTSPLLAAISSLVAFAIGGIIPLAAIMAANSHIRIYATFLAVLIALVITGYLSATIGHAPRFRAILRVTLGGAIAMSLTYGIGHLVGGVIR